MAGQHKIRQLRNKCRQVILIQGQPDCLFEEMDATNYWININGSLWNLGKLGKTIAEHLKSKGCEISETHKKIRRPCSISGFRGLSVQKNNSDTRLQVSAPTEEALQEQICAISDYLSNYGVKLTERCHWVCTFDKAKDKTEPEKKEIVNGLVSNDITNAGKNPDFGKVTAAIQKYIKENDSYSISEISESLHIDPEITEKVLRDLGFKFKPKEHQPKTSETSEERARKARLNRTEHLREIAKINKNRWQGKK